MASSDMLGQETEMIGLQEALSALGAGDLTLGLRQLVKDSDDAKDAFLEVLSELISSEISEAALSPLPLLDEISDRGLGACDWDRVLTSYENTCPLLLACLRATLAARQGQTEQRKDQGKVEAVKSAVGVILSLIFYMAVPESFQIKNHIDTLVSWLPQWEKQMKGGRITRSAKASSPRSSKTPEQSPTKRRRTARHSSPAAQTFSPKTTTIVSSQSDETFGSSLIENMEMSVTDDDNLEETPEPSLTLLTTLKHDAESGNDLVSFSVKQEPSADQSESMIEDFVGDLSDDHHEDLDDKTEGDFQDGETPDGNGPDPDGELVEFEESSSQLSKGKGKKRGKKANRFSHDTNEHDSDGVELKIDHEILELHGVPDVEDLPVEKKNKAQKQLVLCPFCTFQTHSAQSLRRHVLQKHETSQAHHCDLCGKHFPMLSQLTEHIQYKHEGLRHKCHLCNREFKSRAGLQGHIKVGHEGIYKFHCTTCGKKFQTRTQHTAHMNRHDGIKPFVCAACQRGFYLKNHLQRHVKTCRGSPAVKELTIEDLTCNACQKRFATVQILKEHVAAKHEGVKFSCPCGESFNWKKCLYRHQQRCMHMYDA